MDDHAPFLERAFSFVPCEARYRVEQIEGRVPGFVRGTYYVNGPGRFARGPFEYRHWLDGDGFVCALRFDADGVRFTSRFVRTSKLTAEEAAGRPLFRTFGTSFPGDRLCRGIALEPPANVSVYVYASTLLASGEQGLPWELDPDTLETRGRWTFGGCLNEISPIGAHPKIDQATGELLNFGVAFSQTRPCLNVYRFDRRGTLMYRRRIALDEPRSVHDFALGPRHAVFYLSPYILDVQAIVRDGRPVLEALDWRPGHGSRLLIVARASGAEVGLIEIDARYCLHLINCFEEDDRLVVDVVEYERPLYEEYRLPQLFAGVSRGCPVRFVVDLASRRVVERREIAGCPAPDFAAIDPRLAGRPYAEFWTLAISAAGRPGRKFFDRLVHAAWDDRGAPDVYQARRAEYFAGEPAYVGDPTGRSRGVIVCPMLDADRMASAVTLFDAGDVARGPIASLRLRDPIPALFHAIFWPAESR